MSSSDNTAASITQQDDGRIVLAGVLDFQTVPALARQAASLLSGHSDVAVDCTQISSSNSAGLALLLEMSRIMRTSKHAIQFSNVPQQIQTVAHAYGLIVPEQGLETIL